MSRASFVPLALLFGCCALLSASCRSGAPEVEASAPPVKPAPDPNVELGELLDQELRQLLVEQLPELIACHKQERARHPTFQGRFDLQLTIAGSGQVAKIELSYNEALKPSEAFTLCLYNELLTWRFSPFSGAEGSRSPARCALIKEKEGPGGDAWHRRPALCARQGLKPGRVHSKSRV